MFEAFRRYADFSGRSTRTEFWLFVLFLWLVNIGLTAIGVGFAVLLGDGANGQPASDQRVTTGVIGMIVVSVLLALFWVATIVPSLAVAARRMQDQDIPGIVGILLVIVGWIMWPLPFLVMAVFGFLPGKRGPNQFGPDPKGEHAADVFA
jgi:uncharacterized membrane protein YhaH (DUF805 family)